MKVSGRHVCGVIGKSLFSSEKRYFNSDLLSRYLPARKEQIMLITLSFVLVLQAKLSFADCILCVLYLLRLGLNRWLVSTLPGHQQVSQAEHTLRSQAAASGVAAINRGGAGERGAAQVAGGSPTLVAARVAIPCLTAIQRPGAARIAGEAGPLLAVGDRSVGGVLRESAGENARPGATG